MNFLCLLLVVTMTNCQAFISQLSKEDKKLFQDFRKKYRKEYSNNQELEYRFQIFIQNVNRIQQEPTFKGPNGETLVGNSNGQGAFRGNKNKQKFKKGVNQFSDLTDNEFSNSYLLPYNTLYKPQTPKQNYQPGNNQRGRGNNPTNGRKLQQISGIQNLPRRVDWVAQGKITPVKSQKRCNICYGFSAIAALEAAYLIKSGRRVSLSEQEILDCSKENYGCKGGQPSAVFDYVVQNKLSLDKDYPYIAQEHGQCYKDATQIPTTVQGRRLQGRGNGNGRQRGRAQEMNPNLNGTRNPDQQQTTDQNSQSGIDENTLLGFSFNKNDYNYQQQNNYNPYQQQQQQYSYNPYQQQQQQYSYNPYQQQQYNNYQQPYNQYGGQQTNYTPYDPYNNQYNPYGQNNNYQNQYDPYYQNNNQQNTQQPTNQTNTNQRYKFGELIDYQYINQNIIELLKAVNDQPVAVAHYVSSQFKFYAEGVYDGEGCENINTVNHSSLLVGYNLDAEVPYMLFKNSWGNLWGEDGYYKMEIGELLQTNKGLCLVAGTPFNVIPFLG